MGDVVRLEDLGAKYRRAALEEAGVVLPPLDRDAIARAPWAKRRFRSAAMRAAAKLRDEWYERESDDDDTEHVIGRELAVLAGPPGVGKTCAAAWLMLEWGVGGSRYSWQPDEFRRALEHGDDSGRMFVTADRFSQVFDPFGKREHAGARRRITEAGVLVLDDLGTERNELDTALQQVLDTRVTDCATIITTNLTRERLAAKYSERLFDRLQCGRFVPITGKSLRKKGPGW